MYNRSCMSTHHAVNMSSYGTPLYRVYVLNKAILQGSFGHCDFCACGVWRSGSTACPQYVGPLFDKIILKRLVCKLI